MLSLSYHHYFQENKVF